MLESDNIDDIDSLEPLQEDSSLGSISINNEVVANIVALAAREVPGVVSLASGGLKEDIAGFFGSKRDGRVSIVEDENGSYVIGVKLILTFGVQLAKVAEEVQIAIRDQVQNMTNKDVSRVNVIVDGIRQNNPKGEPEEGSPD
ncbi:MAG: Asp23/Gls24 family envelope stress response protein [Opitutales bacterium]|nr:Asp23/Gls24 family envelope stress response protein [Opitutales bacterium]